MAGLPIRFLTMFGSTGNAGRCRRVRAAAVLLVALVAAVSGQAEAASAQGSGTAGSRSSSIAPVVGAYYFDGWAGPGNDRWFAGLVNGPYQGRMPLYGWSDDSAVSMQLQLGWAATGGVNFFAFDWYNQPDRLGAPWANNAVKHYTELSYHSGVKFAIDFINEATPIKDAETWNQVIQNWVTKYFLSESYQRVQGKPLLFIDDAQRMANAFGPIDFLGQLQQAAKDHGLPGVYVVAGARADATHPDLSAWTLGVRYDALSCYGYNYVFSDGNVPITPGQHPYGDLVTASTAVWDLFARQTAFSYIPVVEAGWDPRPWQETIDGKLFWFDRTPRQFSSFVSRSLSWLAANPSHRVDAQPGRPLMLVEAWNELGEGGYIVPTVEDGFRFTEALAKGLRHRE